MRVPVTKMHGTRNDFVLLDARSDRALDLVSLAQWICDRHDGIGADGLLVLELAGDADVRMRIFNADGSEAEMCGNGIRCAARWLDEAGEGADVRFETLAGIVETHVVARDPEYLVRVSMGAPTISADTIAALYDGRFVDLGNPHVVAMVADVAGVDLPALAERAQRLPQFSAGTNVHIAAVEGAALRVRHWERGVGLTMSCGTGAVACAVAAIERGRLTSPVDVEVPGGRLRVEWERGGRAYLTGPAVRVFETEVSAEPLHAMR